MAKSGPDSKSQNNENNDMIDRSISFDQRDMHKSWPMVKGCLMLVGIIVGFVVVSIYVFKHVF